MPFRIEAADISRLNEIQLTQLLQVLLFLEADANGLAKRAVEVSLNIKVGDGGEDGRVSWIDGPDSTDFFPKRLTLFQNKATEMGPTEYGNEILTASGKIKPLVEQVLDSGGAYIVFTTQDLNTKLKQARIDKIREKLNEAGKTYFSYCDILIYDASQISGWVNLYVSAISNVQSWIGRPSHPGIKSFNLWKEDSEIVRFKFCPIASREGLINSLRSELIKSKSVCRITGLSGIGKTRTAFEVFNDQPELNSQVVYFDAAHSSAIILLVTDWVSLGIGAILVVDNCDITLHKSLVREVTRESSKLSLLTLDYNFERVDYPTISNQLRPLTDEEIQQFLEPVYKDRINDLERIARFAQGFPQMAVLLADARLSDDANLGKLNDDDLANKLLWNRNEPPNQDHLKVLRVCSLYDAFGIEHEVEDQLRYIANIAGVDLETVYECVQHYSRRGIIDRRGRYGQVTPKPLAILLAAQWWDGTREQRQKELIDSIPDGMIEKFCEQVKKLDFSPKVKSLTESLCGPQGLFGQAETILSNRGSIFFRAFVEVNPEATSRSLYRVLSTLSNEEILLISDARRNLVWALEKLCFHSEYFEETAWSLLLLASAENETWGNNATGIFTQLFRVRNSGTAANPTQKFDFLSQAIDKNDTSIDFVLIKALTEAISTYGGARTVGAEYQGTKPPIEEWAPKIWQDIFDYWGKAFELLFKIFERTEGRREKVASVIGQSIRGLFSNGRVELLDNAIKKIVSENGRYWPEGLDAIKTIFEHDSVNLTPEAKEYLNSWLEILSPKNEDVAEQLMVLVVNPPWENKANEDGKYVDVARENAEKLAVDIASTIDTLYLHLPLLVNGNQKQAYAFGRQLIISITDYARLFELSLTAFYEAETPNINFLLGMFDGINTLSTKDWNERLVEITANEKLVDFYPSFVITGKITEQHLRVVIDLAKSGKVAEYQVINLAYGSVLASLEAIVVIEFGAELASINQKFAWVSVDILYMYLHSNPHSITEMRRVLVDILANVSLAKNSQKSTHDAYHWKDLIEKLFLEKDTDFAISLSNQLISDSKVGFEHNDLWYAIKPALSAMMKNYGEDIWPFFATAIEQAEGTQLYWLQQLLDRENSFSNMQPCILNHLPTTTVIEWCKANKDLGPVFVASCLDILSANEDKIEANKLFVALLENFGDDIQVKGSLSANMNTRGWCGSLVPYLESDKAALSPLLSHKSPLVRSWVKEHLAEIEHRIAHESTRDDERHLGMY